MTKTKSEILSDLYPDAPSIKTAELEAADVVGLWIIDNPPPTTCVICKEDKPIYAVGRCQACHVAANEV